MPICPSIRPGLVVLRLFWCPLALAVGGFAIALAWALKPRGVGIGGEAAVSVALASVGILLVLSALPGGKPVS